MSTFRARFASTCPRCSEPIHPGDLIGKRPGKASTHVMCVKPGSPCASRPSTVDLSGYVQLRATAPARDRQLVKALVQPARPDEERRLRPADD